MHVKGEGVHLLANQQRVGKYYGKRERERERGIELRVRAELQGTEIVPSHVIINEHANKTEY